MSEWDTYWNRVDKLTPEQRAANRQPNQRTKRVSSKKAQTFTLGQILRRQRSKAKVGGIVSSGRSRTSDPTRLPTRAGAGRSGRGGYNPSRMRVFEIDPRSIDAYFRYAQSMKENAAQFQWGMDRVMMIYAHLAGAAAQKRSLGPVDPMMNNIAAAWRVPVRRITGAYFLGWRVLHAGLGMWVLTNESREAYYIEFGINHDTITGKRGPQGQRVRIRRPVMKLAVMESIKIVQATNAHINQVVSVVGPSGLYQSPYITGAIRPKGQTGSAIGLVNIAALEAMVTAGGGE